MFDHPNALGSLSDEQLVVAEILEDGHSREGLVDAVGDLIDLAERLLEVTDGLGKLRVQVVDLTELVERGDLPERLLRRYCGVVGDVPVEDRALGRAADAALVEQRV